MDEARDNHQQVTSTKPTRVDAGAGPRARDSLTRPANEAQGATTDPSPFLGAPACGLRLDLVLNQQADDEEPFVCLDGRGRYSRILLGSVAVGADTSLQHVALKVQRDVYAQPDETLTNVDIDEMWERERRDLECAQGPGIVQTLPLGGIFESLPIIFCKKTRKYFHPPCPETGAPLTVCRDDQLLRRLGLRSYSAGLVRYLCANGGQKTARGKAVFYKHLRLLEESPAEGVELRYGTELFRDWLPLVHNKHKTEPKAALPCLTCPHRDECYPADAGRDRRLPAENHLVALSYYDFHCIAMRPMDLRYDELCQLLGGADWQAVAKETCGPGQQGRARTLERLNRHYEGRLQWLYRHDHGGRHALEVLRLKLVAFQAICEGLGRIHGECRRAHFDVSPRNVMVHVSEPGYGVPARWCFDVRLIDFGSPRRLRPNHLSARDMPEILIPGPSADDLHIAPELATRIEGASTFGAVSVRDRRELEDRVQFSLEARVDRGFKSSACRPGDVVLVVPGRAQEHWLWAKIEAIRDKAIDLSAEVHLAHPFKAWSVPKTLDANLTFYRSHGPESDLFGLGMLLFRTLLANDGTSEFDVEKLITNCLKRLDVELSEDPTGGGARGREALLAILRDKAAEFDRRNIFYERDARVAPLHGLAEELWHEILLLGFKLVTSVAGFAFAADLTPVATQKARMVAVADELHDLIRQIDVELFAPDLRAREITELCEQLRAETRRRMTQPPADNGSLLVMTMTEKPELEALS